MNNQLANVSLPAGLSLTTLSGEVFTVPSVNDLVDMLPGVGGRDPIHTLKIGQPREANRDLSNRFYLTRKVRAMGSTERTSEYIGPLTEIGAVLRVWPLGFALTRSYMPPFDQNGDDKSKQPLCHSESFTTPDASFVGKFATQCCGLDPKTGKLVPTCPMALWGAKDPVTGKSKPPACGEQYVIFVALSIQNAEGQPELMVAECYFKSISATNGRGLIQQLRAVEQSGKAVYSHPIDLLAQEAGQGNTFKGTLRTDVQADMTDDDRAGFEGALARVQEALKYRIERANKVYQTFGEQAAQEDSGFVVEEAVTGSASNGKNGKASKKPMI